MYASKYAIIKMLCIQICKMFLGTEEKNMEQNKRTGASQKKTGTAKRGTAKRGTGTARRRTGAVQRKSKLLKKNSARYRAEKRKKLILTGIIIVLFLVSGILGVKNREKAKKNEEERILREAQEKAVWEERNTITVGATGCMLLHGPILNSEWYSSDREHFDFSDIYRFVSPYYSEPDFMTCEFEGTLAGSDYSGYPSFFSPDDIIQNIADSGVDLQLLATNHLYDGMSETFHRTMNVYDEKKIPYTGVRQSTEKKNYYIAQVKDIKVGYINYVYETDGSGVELNSAPVTLGDQDLINTFDYNELDKFYQELKTSLSEMKADGADFLIVNIHWGEEYHLEESEYQRRMAQKMCDMGVDAIIGGHPHCEQPVDMLESSDGHKMFCIYSVGNALSNQRKELISEMPDGYTEDGVMVTLTLKREEDDEVVIKDVNLLPTWVYRQDTPKGNQYYILPLENLDKIEETTGLTDIKKDAKASFARTMEVLGPGLEKTKKILNKE